MYEKSNSFVYIFVLSCRFFPNNSGTIGPMKLKIGMLYHINNVTRLTDFEISVAAPLTIMLFFVATLLTNFVEYFKISTKTCFSMLKHSFQYNLLEKSGVQILELQFSIFQSGPYTYFYTSKNITLYTFLLVFKIVESFQCILNIFQGVPD